MESDGPNPNNADASDAKARAPKANAMLVCMTALKTSVVNECMWSVNVKSEGDWKQEEVQWE